MGLVLLLEEPSWCQRSVNPIPRGLSARALSLIAASNPASAAQPRPPRVYRSSEVFQGTCRLGTEWSCSEGSCSAGNPGAESTSPEEQAGLSARCLRSWKRRSTPRAQGLAPRVQAGDARAKRRLFQQEPLVLVNRLPVLQDCRHLGTALLEPLLLPVPSLPVADALGQRCWCFCCPASARVLSNPAHASASLQTDKASRRCRACGREKPLPPRRLGSRMLFFFFPRRLQSPL